MTSASRSARLASACFFTLALSLAYACAAFAQAPSQTIYGPFSAKLPSSKLFSFSGSFNAPSSVTGPYLLRIGLSAPNRLTALSFNLNGVQVLSLADFAGGVAQVDRPATVLASNTYSVRVAGAAGTAITITVFATPAAISSVAPETLVIAEGRSGTLTVTTSVAQASSAILALASSDPTVASVPASVSIPAGALSAQIPVTGLAAGNAQITASLNGTNGSATVQVVAPPVISGETPRDVTLPGGSLPEVGAAFASQASTIDAASVRLRIDGQDVTSTTVIGAAGAVYLVSQPLADATHTVSLSVGDALGGVSTSTWSFTVDDPAPNFYNESPRDVSLADPSPAIRVRLNGSGIVPSSVSIAVDGTDVTAQADAGTDHISYMPSAPLADGIHAVNVAATDARGVSGSKQWSFTIETPPPPASTDDGDRTPRTFVPRVRILQ